MMRYSIIHILSLLTVTIAILPEKSFAMPPDVQSDTWYTQSVLSLYKQGHIKDGEVFRPSDTALRKEVFELIAAIKKESIPDFVRPNQPINRAEMATLLMRNFKHEAHNTTPKFTDVPDNEWYTEPIYNAASLCILQGDANTKNVRPADTINRAEMAIMIQRTRSHLQYPNCTTSTYNNASKWPVRTEAYGRGVVHIIEGFEDPYGLDIIDEMIYVSDGGKGQIVRFTNDLEYRGWLGMHDNNADGWHDSGTVLRKTEPRSLYFPHAIVQLYDGTLLVADYNAKTIYKYTNDGMFIGHFYTTDNIDLAFAGPPTVDLDRSGHVWVSDYAGHRIMKFDQEGNLLGWKGERTNGAVVESFASEDAAKISSAYGGFAYPHQVAVENNGTFYVCDMGNHRIQKFARDGTFIGWIGAKTDGTIASGWAQVGESAPSDMLGGFNKPLSIQLTSDDMLLISDSLNHRLQLFTKEGVFSGWLGAKTNMGVTDGWEKTGIAEKSTKPGGFDRAINSFMHNGKLYTADSNGRIQIFEMKQ